MTHFSKGALRAGATSAAAEHVFSLVEAMTGPDQVRMLADQLQRRARSCAITSAQSAWWAERAY